MILITSTLYDGDKALELGQGVKVWSRRKGGIADLLRGRTTSASLWEMHTRVRWDIQVIEFDTELMRIKDQSEEGGIDVTVSQATGCMTLASGTPLDAECMGLRNSVMTGKSPRPLIADGDSDFSTGGVKTIDWIRKFGHLGREVEKSKLPSFTAERVPQFYFPDPSGKLLCGAVGGALVPVTPFRFPVLSGTYGGFGIDTITAEMADKALVESGIDQVWLGMPVNQSSIAYPDPDQLFKLNRELDGVENILRRNQSQVGAF